MRAGIAVGVLFAVCALSAAPAFCAEPPPVEAYGKLPFMIDPRMSPDGTMVAAIVPSDGKLTVVIHHLDGKSPTVIPVDGYVPDWIGWKTDRRLIVAIHRTARARALQVQNIESRLVAVNSDGFHSTDIGRGRDARFYLRGHGQLESELVDMLPDDPNHLLLTHYVENGLDIEKVDTDTGASNIVEPPKKGMRNWVTDRTGLARIGSTIYQTTQITYARDAGGGEFRKIDATDANFGTPLNPISFSPDPNVAYVRVASSAGYWGLVEYDIAKGAIGRTIASSPDRDVKIVRRDGRLAAYILPDDRAGTEKAVYVDPAWEHDIESINRALPNTLNLILDRTPDGKRLLVSAAGDTEPGAYYVLDRNGPRPAMDMIGERYPDIDPDQVLPAKPISYRSRDGMLIHGYVVLPKDAGSRPVPFVVLPHDGPAAHYEGYFDYLAQFLASRGYGVLQPNVRGSTGYGAKFEQAGLQQWGLAMQDDVTDGTKWLIEQKMADPAKICIMGGGYGGYSALMGVIKEPDLYRCAISLDGVTDLPDYSLTRRFFGAGPAELARYDTGKLSSISPVNLVDGIKASVLLVHGRQDWARPVEQSESMESALKRAGKPVEAIYFDDDEGRGHGGFVSVEANRIAFLRATEAFLKKNIGP